MPGDDDQDHPDGEDQDVGVLDDDVGDVLRLQQRAVREHREQHHDQGERDVDAALAGVERQPPRRLPRSIGGTLLSGGVGLVVGSLVGVLVLGLIQTFISFEGTLSSWWTKIVIGGLLLVFVVLQRVLVRRPG